MVENMSWKYVRLPNVLTIHKAIKKGDRIA